MGDILCLMVDTVADGLAKLVCRGSGDSGLPTHSRKKEAVLLLVVALLLIAVGLLAYYSLR